MSYFKVCPYCGAHLDPGETCDCVSSKYARLTPENKRKIDTFVYMLVEKQKAAQGAANALGGKVEQNLTAVSTSNYTTD